ncbi:hypothetical protein AB0L75_05015 [Streptomyces sp. NPDC052101]|uniref:hypothetical protein n=1 Tax=Streptomyces sp. NPDC052101 TaxID=3155763 RepID=UPI003434365F
MRMRREVRWLLWGLWGACLVFSVWFIVVVALFLSQDMPFDCWMESCAPPGR